MARERESEAYGGVEVGTGDVPDGVDHDHDHEPEADGDANMAKNACLGIDHDRAAAGENEREGSDRLSDK